jgi:hypothetical protein
VKINNAPARYEGPYSQLGALIRREAVVHLDIAVEIEAADPATYTGSERTSDIRRLNIECGIWQMLATGWARPLEDWSGMVFWHPERSEFVPWSAELNLCLMRICNQMRPVVDAYVEGASEGAPSVVGNDYPGRRLPALFLTDDDERLVD